MAELSILQMDKSYNQDPRHQVIFVVVDQCKCSTKLGNEF